MKKLKSGTPKAARPQQSTNDAVEYELLSRLPAMPGEQVLDIVMTKARKNPTGQTLSDVMAFAKKSIDRGRVIHERLSTGRKDNNAHRRARARSWKEFISDRARIAWSGSGINRSLSAERMADKLIKEWRDEQQRLKSIGAGGFVDELGPKISTVTRHLRPIRQDCIEKKKNC
jgi:hypothetical protein